MAVPAKQVRPVKFLIEADLARRLEAAVAHGLGGHYDRHGLVAAAVDSYLLDLEYPGATGDVPPHSLANEFPSPQGDHAPPAAYALPRLAPGTAVEDEASRVRREPMFGLHNRDWPSLWALSRLAQMADAGPVHLDDFLESVTREAWLLGDFLAARDGGTGKPTALLPSNREKPQSAEDAFRAFAIATIGRRPDAQGRFDFSGPLPTWRTVALRHGAMSGQLDVGVTAAGWELIDLVGGLDVGSPHPRQYADRFLNFIRLHAGEEDWWGFRTLLDLMDHEPTRTDLVAHFAKRRDWKESVAASTAQGYIARAREWGLLEPKLVAGRYALTTYGTAFNSGSRDLSPTTGAAS